MERNGMTETAKRHAYWWWFDRQEDHVDNRGRSQWLHSTLSELDDRAKSMLRIIEQDADSFAQRAEMYYKKRPQLVSLVEDFYRVHRSLAIQFDHLRHDPATRRISPLVRSFSLTTEKAEDPHNLAYDSEESIDSEVDDPEPEVSYDEVNVADLMDEIERLKEEAVIRKKQLMEKERAMEELKRKLYETCNQVVELKEETEALRVENVEMCLLRLKDADEKEAMGMNLQTESERREEMVEEKDEEKREAIRQLSVAIEMLKRENGILKKSVAKERAKKWNPFESLKGFRKLFKTSTVVPM